VVNPWPSGPPAVGRPVTNAVAPGAAELARALRPRLRGEVRIDPGVRALYSTDASNYRQLPIAVVTPRDAADVEATLEACSQCGLPVLSRGGGTSLAGQTCNTAVVLDFSRHMNQILQIDLEGRTATVQPGVVLDDLRDALTADGLTFGPDPATHNRCTLGGMIGNNSCGTHSLTTGPTADNVDALEVITYDGVRMWVGATADGELDRLVTAPGRTVQIRTGLVQLRDRNVDLIRQCFPRTPRRVSGYNLDQLLPENHFNLARALVGTEGTCVVVLKAKLRLTPLPPVRRTFVIGFEDAAAAADAVPAVLERKPYGLEGFDDVLMRDVRKLGLHRDGWPLLPDGGGWLLVELGGESEQEVEEDARRLAAAYDSARALTPRQSQHVWGIRESGLGAAARVPGEAPTWPGWEDSAVDPFVLGDYLRDLRRLYNRYGYHAALYGHYGQGCVHFRVDFDLASADGIATFRRFLDDAADVCVLSHWYTWRAAAYTLGRTVYVARLALLAPRLTNVVTHLPVLSPALKRAAGVHPDRDAPRFVSTTFRPVWANRSPNDRQPTTPGGQWVLLWPDTFTNYFRPDVGVAAVRVLEHAGCNVRLAGDGEAPLCCGRPLFDWGLLRQARRMLQRTLDAIGDQIDAGITLVVLEPSCASVFRGRADRAAAPRRTSRPPGQADVDLAGIPGTALPPLESPDHPRRGHGPGPLPRPLGPGLRRRAAPACPDGRRRIRPVHRMLRHGRRVRLRDRPPRPGHRDREQLLLPAVRTAGESTAVVADGFSCHEQIRQETRQPVHVAEVVAAALADSRTARAPDEGETP